MARACTVCSHPKRSEIDRALVGDVPIQHIAERYGLVDTSIRRHEKTHLPARLVKAAEKADVTQALDVVAQLKAINGASLQILQKAKEAGNGGLALRAIDRIQRQIELQAKLLGELNDAPTINVTLSPEWLEIRMVIFDALSEHPEARVALAEALHAVEGGEHADVA